MKKRLNRKTRGGYISNTSKTRKRTTTKKPTIRQSQKTTRKTSKKIYTSMPAIFSSVINK